MGVGAGRGRPGRPLLDPDILVRVAIERRDRDAGARRVRHAAELVGRHAHMGAVLRLELPELHEDRAARIRAGCMGRGRRIAHIGAGGEIAAGIAEHALQDQEFLERDPRIDRVLIGSVDLRRRVTELGREISAEYTSEDPPILVSILKGGVVFLSDLIRSMTVTHEIDFMAVSSYSGQNTTGVVKINMDLQASITGRHVLIVEDIVDTGLTLNHLIDLLSARKPRSLRVCALLNKVDLAPHCDVDLDLYEDNLRRVNPTIEILRVSARTGEGMEAWIAWLNSARAAKSAKEAAE